MPELYRGWSLFCQTQGDVMKVVAMSADGSERRVATVDDTRHTMDARARALRDMRAEIDRCLNR
jgi:hypothetical protein